MDSIPYHEIVITIISSLASIMLVIFLFNKTASKLASEWVKNEFEILEKFEIEKFIDSNRLNSGSKNLNERIKRQYLNSKEKAIQHFTIMKHFQVRYYTVINLTAVCGIISAITAFIIMNKGWQESKEVVITVFFVFSGVTTYTAAFPKFFSHKLNISKNKVKSLKYRQLMNRIETFLCTGYDSSMEKVEMEKFIVRIDNELEKLIDYPISMEMDTNFKPEDAIDRLK